jgi:hypothetical protein
MKYNQWGLVGVLAYDVFACILVVFYILYSCSEVPRRLGKL